jgi:hypothetical protein
VTEIVATFLRGDAGCLGCRTQANSLTLRSFGQGLADSDARVAISGGRLAPMSVPATFPGIGYF